MQLGIKKIQWLKCLNQVHTGMHLVIGTTQNTKYGFLKIGKCINAFSYAAISLNKC